jgi:hypothetical protein
MGTLIPNIEAHALRLPPDGSRRLYGNTTYLGSQALEALERNLHRNRPRRTSRYSNATTQQKEPSIVNVRPKDPAEAREFRRASATPASAPYNAGESPGIPEFSTTLFALAGGPHIEDAAAAHR